MVDQIKSQANKVSYPVILHPSPHIRKLLAGCFTALLSFPIFTFNTSCTGGGTPAAFIEMRGETMGTYYFIKAQTDRTDLDKGIDSTLEAFNAVFSTYDPASLITGFNSSGSNKHCMIDREGHFLKTLEVSAQVFEQTGGYFDPTVMPLVDFWGFGREKFQRSSVHDISDINSILALVGYSKITWSREGDSICLHRENPLMELDMSAIAKGYGVDLVADYLESQGCSDYIVEIGGEITVMGKNDRQALWTVGIDKPVSSKDLSRRENQAIVQLDNRSIASSGNYRNFYEVDGRLIGHTINPFTAYPEVNDLLAVSVVAEDCIYADALATGFMAMGFSEAMSIADELEKVDAFFVRMDSVSGKIKTAYTPGFKDMIVARE